MTTAYALTTSKNRGPHWLASGLLLLALGTMAPVHAASQASFSVLHAFSANEGSVPAGPLLQGADGRFYGGTTLGGSNGQGTIYAVSSTGTLTVLHAFAGSDGAHPAGALTAGTDGTLYGVTEYGGDNDAGTVFSITPGGVFKLLHSFAAWTDNANADGMAPRGGLTLGSDGNFYGATSRGGSNDGGTLFRITPAGALTTLYTFGALSSARADGAVPSTPLIPGADGRFYSTTSSGGSYSSGGLAPGTLYALGLDGNFSALHSFTSAMDGASPSGLVAASDGNFYGATSAGGPNGSGTLFKATAAGDVTTIYSFATGAINSSGLMTNSDGLYPVSGVIAANDGTLYGGTVFGGSNGTGNLFSLAPDNTLTILYQFSSASSGINSDGAAITTAPIRGSDGNLYGATALGGSNGMGVIYKVTMPALPTVTLTLGTSQITSGSSTSLTWSTSGALSCTASGGWSGSRSGSGSSTVNPTSNTTYALSCRNISGATATATTLAVSPSSSDGGGGTTTGTSSKGGGGGAMPPWLAAWALIAIVRRRMRLQRFPA